MAGRGLILSPRSPTLGGMRAAAFLLLAGCHAASSTSLEQVRYLRATARGAAPECSFTIAPAGTGWSIASLTGSLTVEARYGAGDDLLDARASLASGASATVGVADGLARVSRPGHPPQEFAVPKDVVVTSAPDWSDVFRIARRWKASGPARQEFAGLWIHPAQPAQRLVFSAERSGVDVLDGLRLERLTIRLRGNSPYAAWVDPGGRLIKLVSLPFKPGSTVLTLEGVDASALLPD